MHNVWSNAISDADRIAFIDSVANEFGDESVDIEDVTLSYEFMLAQGAVGGANALATYDVIAMAAADATAAGPTDLPLVSQPEWITTRTLDPTTGAQNKVLPRSLQVLIGGIGVVVQVSSLLAPGIDTSFVDPRYDPAAVAADLLHGIQAAFDSSTIEITNGRIRRAEVKGHEAVSYGASRVALYTPATVSAGGANIDPIYSGQQSTKDRGWRRLKPIVFGSDQQIGCTLYVPRSTLWPIPVTTRIRVGVMMPSLIARASKGARYPRGKSCA